MQVQRVKERFNSLQLAAFTAVHSRLLNLQLWARLTEGLKPTHDRGRRAMVKQALRDQASKKSLKGGY